MRIGIIGLITLVGLALSACNTVQGVGRDMKSVGNTMEKAAD